MYNKCMHSIKGPYCWCKAWNPRFQGKRQMDSAHAMAECPIPQGTDAVEDDSVEVKCMTLKEAQAASAGLFHFLQENGSPLAKDAGGIMKEVGKMILTTRHREATVQDWFSPKPSAGDGGCPP